MKQKIKKIKKPLYLFIIVATLLYPIISITSESQFKSLDPKSFFKTEKEYLSYINKKINIPNMKFSIHKIKMRDNYWTIAKKNKININSLIGTNPFWEDLLARINKVVVIPSEKGVLHFIEDPDNLEKLKSLYNCKDEDLKIQKLPIFYKYYHKFLSKKTPIAVFVKNRKPSTIAMTAKLGKLFTTREMFRSPLGGRLSSFFGNRRHPILKRRKLHNGIDIAAPRGRLIGASRAGVVIATGWMGGYGKAVIVKHDNGFKTLYGHMSRILTRKGRRLKAGSVVGRVGSTGMSTGPHLHFTMWKNGKLINPLKYLW